MSPLPIPIAPSAEAKAAVEYLLFDDIADHAAMIGAQAIKLAAAAERRDLIETQARFGLLRLAAIALFDDLERLDGERG